MMAEILNQKDFMMEKEKLMKSLFKNLILLIQVF